MMKKFALLSLLLAGVSAHAFRLDPMVVELSPKGEGSSKVFRVENNGQERVAVQIKATGRSIDEKGKETRDSSADFAIYPDQISLGPNDVRNVRVTYKGSADIDREKAYRVIASQLPVDFKGESKQMQLNFLFQYVASVYVKPAGSIAKLEVASVEAADAKHLKIKIANTGSAHRLLKGVRPTVTAASGEKVKIIDSAYEQWDGENLLADSARVILVETAESIPKGALKASLSIPEAP